MAGEERDEAVLMDTPQVQLLLAGRPICTRCMHGNQVEEIKGRMNSPVEYHCGCGNYAVVGMPARWPFMEAVKGPANQTVNPANNISRNDSGRNISENCSSPLQVGESLVKSRVNYSKDIIRKFPRPAQRAVITEKKTAEKCKPKQEERMDDFFKKYGMTEEEYKANKNYRLESPARVAKRLGKAGTEVAPAAEAKPTKPEPEKKKPVPETKAPAAETIPPKEEPKATPPETAKPGKPIGVIGKDYITIVCREEFIDRIREHANAEFRTPELQVVYYLHKGMEACGA